MEQSGGLYHEKKLKTPYIHSEEIHNMTAPREVVPHIMKLVKPLSVLDVGCGTGMWLKAFEEMGVSDYAGVDGDYVNRENLKINGNKFHPIDLRKVWSINRKFDLVVSLEVAEHLPQASADIFVNALVDHGDTILFSAAIPGQGGQNHLNEQWPAYWQQKFLKHGFYFHDVIRPLIWDNENVAWWYKQNIFLVTKDKIEVDMRSNQLIHPAFVTALQKRNDQYVNELIDGKQGLYLAIRIFYNAIIFKLRSLLGSKT